MEKQWPGNVISQTFFEGTHWKIVAIASESQHGTNQRWIAE